MEERLGPGEGCIVGGLSCLQMPVIALVLNVVLTSFCPMINVSLGVRLCIYLIIVPLSFILAFVMATWECAAFWRWNERRQRHD